MTSLKIRRHVLVVVIGMCSWLVCPVRMDADDRTKKSEVMKELIEKVKRRDLPLESRRAAANTLLEFLPEGLGTPAERSDDIREKVVPMLLSIATDRKEDSEIRKTVIRTIGDLEIQSDLAVEKLTPLLLDETEDSGVRSRIAMVLNDLGPSEDISAAILTAAASPNEVVRVNASAQLGTLQLPHDVLLQWAAGAAGDPLPHVRRSAINIAGKTISEANADTDIEAALDIITKGTMDQDPSVRQSAVFTLSILWRQVPRIAEYARQLLRNSDNDVRLNAAVLLLKHNASHQEARSIITEGLQSEDPQIRAKSLHALGYLEREIGWVVQAVEEGLDDQDERARVEAAFSLIRITGKSVRGFPVLLTALKSTDELNRHLALAYVGFIVPRATDLERILLLQAAQDKDHPMRCALFEFLDLAGVDRAQVLNILSEAVADEDAQLRVCALDILGRLGPAAESALPAVTAAKQDPIAEVREAAKSAEQRILRN